MVTVIIPTYKRARYIDRAIKSVFDQSYSDIEIIVVDDNDASSNERRLMEEKMKKYEGEKNFRYIKHQKNRNGAVARNTGIKIAKGEYITFLDDDDYFISNRIEILVDYMEKNKEYQMAYTNGFVCNGKKVVNKFNGCKEMDYIKELLLVHSFIGTGSNMFFRTDALRSIEGFDINFKRHQDLEVLIRFLCRYKIKGIDKILVIKDNTDRCNQPDVEGMTKAREFYLNRFRDIIEKYDDKKYIYFENYFNLMIYAIRCNNRKAIKSLYKKACEYKRFGIKQYFLIIKTKLSTFLPTVSKKIPISIEEKNIIEEFRKV